MRAHSVWMCVVLFALPIHAATTVTVAQLEHFLSSSRAGRMSDEETADRLSAVSLSEQLTAVSLNRIRMETNLGPKSEEQLDLLAAASIVAAPPADEVPKLAAPSSREQERIVQAARDYTRRALALLPDFVAVRSTRYFTNVPAAVNGKRVKPRILMHQTRESRREIVYRDGHEMKRAIGAPGSESGEQSAMAGLSTWGEFGAILTVALNDSSADNLQWSRWQKGDAGIQLAVFRYTVPRVNSHYKVDFCCFQKSLDEPVDYEFHDKPGYAGEIYIDPTNGEINQITLDAQLDEGPVSRSAIAVRYGPVIIAGKRYVCPLWSIAISDFDNALIEKIDGVGTERHLNETEFTGYHKFGSTSRILSDAVGAPRN